MELNKKFAITGAAGYVAPRHMRAIVDVGGKLVAALDPHDSVGIIDQYAPGCVFFTESERFDRYLEKQYYKNDPINYLSVCSPNYLHDAHCRLGMRAGADIICEKPVVINPWNISQLREVEVRYNKKVNVILQLRLHPAIIKLKQEIDLGCPHVVNIRYVTPRGKWYDSSWKNDMAKSGGILMNIGVHLFDMLIWIFGEVWTHKIKKFDPHKVSGEFTFVSAQVNWVLSIDENDVIPGRDNREITVDGEQISLDGSFTELHTEVYKKIMLGDGFGLDDAEPAINLIYRLRRKNV